MKQRAGNGKKVSSVNNELPPVTVDLEELDEAEPAAETSENARVRRSTRQRTVSVIFGWI